MSVFLDAYYLVCDKSQEVLERNSPIELPKGILRGLSRSFVVSFIGTTILTGGNPMLGLIGGTIGALATSINALLRIALQQFQNVLSRSMGRPNQPLDFGARMVADMVGVGAALLCAGANGLGDPLYTVSLLITAIGAAMFEWEGPPSHVLDHDVFIVSGNAILVM